jgi:glycosyltransferase involved in cell wall biosynthesis
MIDMQQIWVIIPAHNEQQAISHVISDIPDLVKEIVVVCNVCTDNTAEKAAKAGATVLTENRKGYGYACLKGMEYLEKKVGQEDIVVFLDGDHSDHAEQLAEIVKPILNLEVDFVIGARVKHLRERGAMTPQQIFGNALATTLMKWFFRSKFTDLGPFRALKYKHLLAMNMEDKTYGWTVEMQLKALKMNLKYTEVPVRYRNRIGVSKVSGTLKGTVLAGYKILLWIFKYGLS